MAFCLTEHLSQSNKMKQTISGSIVFITGTFLGHNCWDKWITYFESKGYDCIAPAWPYKDAPPEELRNRNTGDPLALNRLKELTDYFAAIINKLPAKPIIMGHALGGLVVQLLAQRQLSVAAVAIHSFPPAGLSTLKFSFRKAVWEAMALFTPARTSYLVSFKRWKYSIANGMTSEQQKELYYQYAIPESKLVIRDAFSCSARIDFRIPHVPLLFTSGSLDQVTPVSLNYKNYKKYQTADSVASYKNFKHHNHLVFDHPAWRREAGYIHHWLQGMK